jgi:hypothetical protein
MRARCQFEPLDEGGPLRLASAEPSLVAHDRPPAVDVSERTEGPADGGRSGVRWIGLDGRSGVAQQGQASEPDRDYRIPAVKRAAGWDDSSVRIRPKMR